MAGRVKTFFVFILILVLAGCASGVNDESYSEALTSSSVSKSVSAESTKPKQASEPEIMTIDVLAPDIHKELIEKQISSDILISFNAASAMINKEPDKIGSIGYNLRNNFLQGLAGGGMQGVCTYDLEQNKFYESTYWASYWANVKFLQNEVVAIVCVYQNFAENVAEDFSSNHPLLLDKYCQPLGIQLQFDYGESFTLKRPTYGDGYSGEQYRIMGLTYDMKTEQYIATFSSDAFWDSTGDLNDFEKDNDNCKLGIAIFDKDGRQIERYDLSEVYYPQFSSPRQSTTSNPELIVTENNELLIIPQGGCKIRYGEERTLHPVYVNLDTREHELWTQERMEEFLETNTRFEGEFASFVLNDNITVWRIREKPVPFTIVEDTDSRWGDVILIYVPGNEQAIFALPGKSIFDQWTQTDDGMLHAVFRANY